MFKTSIKILSLLLLVISNVYLYAEEIMIQDSLARVLLIENDPDKRMDILIELTKSTLTSEPDRALDYANQIVDLAIEFDYPENRLRAWLLLGDIYWNKSDYRSSLEFGNRAKALAIDLELDRELAESLIIIARNFSNLGDFEKSAGLNFQALAIFEKLGDKKGVGTIFHRIGVDYYEQDFLDKALEYHTKALAIAREINNLNGIARGLNNVAIIYASKGDFPLAEANLKESVEINKILNSQLRIGVAYSNLGYLYREEKKYDTAFYYLNRSAHLLIPLKNHQKLPDIYYGLSLYYLDVEKLDSSLYYANLSYKASVENQQKTMILKAAEQLTKLYQLQHDFENAFTYSMIKSELKDSLATEVSIARVSHLELLYEFDKAEQENKIVQQRREYNLILIGAAIVFILLAMFLTLITRHRLKSKNQEIERHRLSLELETKNKELTANVMNIIRKNEILSEMGNKLMDIQSDAVKEETKSAIKRISSELQKSTDDDVWNEFDTRFRQVHGAFYDRLIKQFPNLTPNEQKICAFLRLNMSTKDISELTGQQTTSIERARTRLRKKLGLANTNINLISFLAKM